MPTAKLDWSTIRKLDRTGRKLNIFTFNVSILISSLCDKSLEILDDFKRLTENVLNFLDQNDLRDTEFTKKVLKIYEIYFNNRISLD